MDHPELTFNGASRVKEHKHLGLILEPNLSFEKHLYEKMVKAKQNIGIIKHLNRFLPFKTRDQMYKALVRSHLSERRMCKRVLQIHKIVDGRTPSYLRDRRKLPNLPCVFQKIKCRTDAISIWNNIIPNFEYLPSFERLKKHLISLIRPKLIDF